RSSGPFENGRDLSRPKRRIGHRFTQSLVKPIVFEDPYASAAATTCAYARRVGPCAAAVRIGTMRTIGIRMLGFSPTDAAHAPRAAQTPTTLRVLGGSPTGGGLTNVSCHTRDDAPRISRAAFPRAKEPARELAHSVRSAGGEPRAVL